MRRFLESLGALFGQVGFEVGMGVIAAVIAYIKTAPFYWLILLIIGVPICCRAIGVFATWLSENIPPNITVVPQPLEILTRDKDGSFLVDNFAPLKVVNNEYFPIIDFYAVLKEGRATLGHADLGTKYLKWKEAQNCKITIDARGGEQLLYVYQVSIRYDPSGRSFQTFNFFSLCGNSQSIISLLPGRTVIDIRIEFHGVLNNKSVRARDFIGYILLTNSQDTTGRLSIHMYKGKPPKKLIGGS